MVLIILVLLEMSQFWKRLPVLLGLDCDVIILCMKVSLITTVLNIFFFVALYQYLT